MNSISKTYTAEINVIDADVDLGSTNATTWVLLMESDLKSVYAVFIRLYSIQLFVTIVQKLLILGCKK